MTKSTITDKRVTSVIERLEHYACNLKWTNVRGAQDLLAAADGLRDLQERRKADSEPVSWTWQHLKQWHVTNDEERARDLAWDGVKVEPLYRRAAMLAAAPQLPGSEPATVPGKWSPVSERMPIEFEAVIAFDGDQVYGEAMYSSDDGFTIDGYEPCDRLNLQNVTHWMPLPAAPQEVR